jgi:hypothetical protein
MLRETEGVDYWSGAGWTAFATYSNAPVHQNQDKLSLMLYGDGRHWLVDCEARSGSHHAFSSDVQRELNRSTLCHNTVLIGNRDQAFPSRRLDLVECSFLPEVKRVTIGDLDGRLYEGVRQLRTLLVTNAYVLDFFQVQCEDKREISWLTHVNGAPEGSSADSWRPISLEEEGPWKWLVNPEQSESVSAYSESFTAGDDVFRMDVALNGPVQVIRCGFPKSDSVEPETWPMRMLGAKRKAAWFCAVYHKGKEALAPAEIEVAPGQMDHWDIAVTIHGETRRHLAPLLPALR